jgi:hypothetical protein
MSLTFFDKFIFLQEYQVSHTEMQSNLQQLQTVMDGQVELIASLEQKVLTSDRIRAEQLLELEKLRSDLHEEKLQKDNAVEILQDQLREAKASISRKVKLTVTSWYL